VEVIIFTSKQPVTKETICESLNSYTGKLLDIGLVEESLNSLRNKYSNNDFSFELVKIGGGYQFLSKSEFQNIIGTYLQLDGKKRLTRAAIETLSIIAYKQPVSRIEIDSIRGVNSEYTIHKLLEKELIEIRGRDNGPGRPLIYQTSIKFLDYFGINSLNELPKLKEIERDVNKIGVTASIDENNFAVNN